MITYVKRKENFTNRVKDKRVKIYLLLIIV